MDVHCVGAGIPVEVKGSDETNSQSTPVSTKAVVDKDICNKKKKTFTVYSVGWGVRGCVWNDGLIHFVL